MKIDEKRAVLTGQWIFASTSGGESMKPVDRQKICPNCDGRIPYDAAQCTYCFATLQVDNSSSKLFSSPETPLYTPPYSAKLATEPSQPRATVKSVSPENTEVTDAQSFLPILCLILGGNLLTLGILQFFFSDHGVVRLEINGSYWFLMLLVSLPLFYYGLKSSNQKN